MSAISLAFGGCLFMGHLVNQPRVFVNANVLRCSSLTLFLRNNWNLLIEHMRLLHLSRKKSLTTLYYAGGFDCQPDDYRSDYRVLPLAIKGYA